MSERLFGKESIEGSLGIKMKGMKDGRIVRRKDRRKEEEEKGWKIRETKMRKQQPGQNKRESNKQHQGAPLERQTPDYQVKRLLSFFFPSLRSFPVPVGLRSISTQIISHKSTTVTSQQESHCCIVFKLRI